MENVKKPNKKYLITKILITTKLPNPIRKTRVLKLVFITIPCLKFWALVYPIRTKLRLYRIFLKFMVPCNCELDSIFLKSFNIEFYLY